MAREAGERERSGWAKSKSGGSAMVGSMGGSGLTGSVMVTSVGVVEGSKEVESRGEWKFEAKGKDGVDGSRVEWWVVAGKATGKAIRGSAEETEMTETMDLTHSSVRWKPARLSFSDLRSSGL
jgi:hypothetical protein